MYSIGDPFSDYRVFFPDLESAVTAAVTSKKDYVWIGSSWVVTRRKDCVWAVRDEDGNIDSLVFEGVVYTP